MNHQELLAKINEYQNARNIAIGIIIGLGLCTVTRCARASPFYLVAGAGQAQSKLTGDGIWYQEGFDHSINSRSVDWNIGGGYQIRNWLATELLYHDFGKTHINADWVTPDDNYNLQTHGCNGSCNPIIHGSGSGHDTGVSLSILPSVDLGPTRLYGRAGVLFYRSRWEENYSCCKVERYFPEAPYHDFPVRHWNGDGPGQPQPYASGHTSLVGIGLSYKSVALEYMRTGTFSKASGSGFNAVQTLTVNYRYYF